MSESPCEGIRLHFLLRRKLLFRCHPTGSLDSIFESRCKAKKKDTHKGVLLFVSLAHFRCHQKMLQPIMYIHQHPYGTQPDVHGFSHGLKKCPPDTFLPSLRSGRPFESSAAPPKRRTPKWVSFFLCLVNTIDAIKNTATNYAHPSASL